MGDSYIYLALLISYCIDVYTEKDIGLLVHPCCAEHRILLFKFKSFTCIFSFLYDALKIHTFDGLEHRSVISHFINS
uniref:Uncharacterized protein n=1 Tax=Anguilla anguilla TaxID=7936 RepID=A0A0E9X2J7_ANGAN